MWLWIKHFFDYYYESPPGDGWFGTRHLIWIASTIILSIAFYQYFKRHPKYAGKFMFVVCVLLFITRLTKQIYRAASGIDNPPLLVVPWQLCTIMTFVMPIVLIFNIKKLKPMIYSLCMIGGIVTLILGSYFGNEFLTFYEWEPMLAHMLLIFIPVIEMAIGNFKLEFKNAWQTVVGLFICTAWALLADLVLFVKYDTNNSELIHNNLGFDIPGIPFRVLYFIIGIVFILVMYGIPTIYRKINHKRL